MSVALDTSLAAIRDQTRAVERVARRVAVDPLADPAGDSVDLLRARAGVRAASAVLRTADEVERGLLDLLA